MALIHDPRPRKIFQSPIKGTNKSDQNEDASRAQQRNQIRHLRPLMRAPRKSRRLNSCNEPIRFRLPFRSSQGPHHVNLTAHGYPTLPRGKINFRPKHRAHGSAITMDARFVSLPSMPACRAHRDDIVLIACASATLAHHSHSQSQLQKSKSKPESQAFGMFPIFGTLLPVHFNVMLRRLQGHRR